MKPILHRLFAFSCLSVSLSTALAQTAPATSSAPAATPYGIGAQRAGVVACVPRINQVTGFLAGRQPNSGFVLTSPNRNADTRISSTIMEIQVAETASSYVSANFASAADGSCSATYEAITYWSSPCTQVASSNFASLRATGPLLKNINTLDGGPLLKVFLMPLGETGCLSIKKESVY